MHSLGQVRVKYYKRNVGWTMKSRYRFFCFTLTFVLVLCTAAQVSGSTGTDEKKAVSSIVQMIPAAVDMKETDGPGNLYALSAVLMDGDSGRVLYEKEGYTARPNASTTKVMTCILALEKGSGDDYVMVSENAASQPEVKLNLKEGEQYYLEDLLYSLMLKSHNDTAVAIAEHIGPGGVRIGAVKAADGLPFADALRPEDAGSGFLSCIGRPDIGGNVI